MKQYEELQMNIFYMKNADILTYSNEQDNDVEDDNWFDE